jgi:hypothetical protein
MEYRENIDRAHAKKKQNKKWVQRLKKNPPKDLDHQFQEAHNRAFETIDCLKCANCCKTTSPGMKERDVERMARHLQIKPSEVIERYMKMDSDGEYVFRWAPCPFLGEDNYCSIYESRPQACRGFPHTDRKNVYQLLDLSLRNTLVCPAVSKIFEELRDQAGTAPRK